MIPLTHAELIEDADARIAQCEAELRAFHMRKLSPAKRDQIAAEVCERREAEMAWRAELVAARDLLAA